MQGYVFHRLSCAIVHVFVSNFYGFVASNSFRFVVLSFKFYSSLHLYCYFEKTNKLAVPMCKYMYVRLCSPLGAFGAV